MTGNLRDVLAENLSAEGDAYLGALEAVPEDLFGVTPPVGGHSPAWHALHIQDWTRLLLSDLGGTPASGPFAYLGWEDAEWARQLSGPAELGEADGQAAILAALRATFERAVHDTRQRAAEDFTPDARLRTPRGERPLIPTLLAAARHIAYHRGQVKLATLQLEQGRL